LKNSQIVSLAEKCWQTFPITALVAKGGRWAMHARHS
jgi:hypothetical protein